MVNPDLMPPSVITNGSRSWVATVTSFGPAALAGAVSPVSATSSAIRIATSPSARRRQPTSRLSLSPDAIGRSG